MAQDPVYNKSTLVQAITWTNVGPNRCRHMASPGQKELNQFPNRSFLICYILPFYLIGERLMIGPSGFIISRTPINVSSMIYICINFGNGLMPHGRLSLPTL